MSDVQRDRSAAADVALVARQLALLASAFDRRDWVELANFFTPEATAYGIAGTAEIVAAVRSRLGGCGPSQHLLGNCRVQIEGDRASSLTYVRAAHQGKGDRAGLSFEVMGEYQDSWARTAVGWKMSSRVFDVFMTQGDGGVLQPG